MNKNEQAQLCMLLAKMRYDIMQLLIDSNNSEFIKKQEKLIESINMILSYSYIDGEDK